MALKVELKPGEKIIIGDCVVTNHDQRTRLMIEGQVPILREKDILTPQRADTPAKRIYLTIQLMYTSRAAARLSRALLFARARHHQCGTKRLAIHRNYQQSYLNRRDV